MKKTVAIILIMFLIFSVCSCDGKDTEVHTSDTTIQQNDDVAIDSTSLDVEHSLLTLETINDYNKFINSEKLPSNFVSYDKIDDMGQFVSLVFLSDTQKGDYSSYMYNIVDSTGYEICLYVEVAKDPNELTSSISQISSDNMRTLDKSISGVYNNDGYKYQYVSGMLLSISWIDEDISYELCGASMLYDYPQTDNTFVGKVLNLKSAYKTFKEINS